MLPIRFQCTPLVLSTLLSSIVSQENITAWSPAYNTSSGSWVESTALLHFTSAATSSSSTALHFTLAATSSSSRQIHLYSSAKNVEMLQYTTGRAIPQFVTFWITAIPAKNQTALSSESLLENMRIAMIASFTLREISISDVTLDVDDNTKDGKRRLFFSQNEIKIKADVKVESEIVASAVRRELQAISFLQLFQNECKKLNLYYTISLHLSPTTTSTSPQVWKPPKIKTPAANQGSGFAVMASLLALFVLLAIIGCALFAHRLQQENQRSQGKYHYSSLPQQPRTYYFDRFYSL